jgi:hypothetical protein
MASDGAGEEFRMEEVVVLLYLFSDVVDVLVTVVRCLSHKILTQS